MKQRPILFSAAMVRAILAGKKTQTRRVCKKQPRQVLEMLFWDYAKGLSAGTCGGVPQCYLDTCPYGQIGDQLWVRETYAEVPKTAYANSNVFQKVSTSKEDKAFVYRACFDLSASAITWKPSIFMPRAASRILLEITAIRVERVQDISEHDAIAEGIEFSSIGGGMDAHQNYCGLWSKINGNQSWIENPWVWVVEFKRVEVST